MTKPVHTDAPIGGAMLPAVLLAALACALFSLCGSLFVAYFLYEHPELGPLNIGIGVRIAGFATIALLLHGILRRLPQEAPVDFPTPPLMTRRDTLIGAVVLAVLVCTLFLPRLDVYPWAAPDEVHHLTVAKNIAVRGAYASGHPDEGLDYFDTYDSVGGPVLLPVAGAFQVFGVGLGVARGVMVLFFLMLLGACACFMTPITGGRGAVLPSILLCVSFSSIYLARTLYGEAPALMYFVLGLLAWRRSMHGTRAWVFGVLAGILFALAVLSKTLLVLTVFCFATAWIWDLRHGCKIGAPQILGTAAGGGAVLLCWWIFEMLSQGDLSDNAGDTAGIYYHYLFFGVEPVWDNLKYAVLPYWLAHVAYAAGWGWLMVRTLRRGDDPALLVLLLAAALYFYWWLFFTPGQLARYLWTSYAVCSLGVGALLHHLLTAVRWKDMETHSDQYNAPTSPLIPLRRGTKGNVGLRIGAILLLLAPFAHWAMGQYTELYTKDEMTAEYAIAEELRAYPATVSVQTTFEPLVGSMNFLANRAIDGPQDAAPGPTGYDVIVSLNEDAPPMGDYRPRRFGRYTLHERTGQ